MPRLEDWLEGKSLGTAVGRHPTLTSRGREISGEIGVYRPMPRPRSRGFAGARTRSRGFTGEESCGPDDRARGVFVGRQSTLTRRGREVSTEFGVFRPSARPNAAQKRRQQHPRRSRGPSSDAEAPRHMRSRTEGSSWTGASAGAGRGACDSMISDCDDKPTRSHSMSTTSASSAHDPDCAYDEVLTPRPVSSHEATSDDGTSSAKLTPPPRLPLQTRPQRRRLRQARADDQGEASDRSVSSSSRRYKYAATQDADRQSAARRFGMPADSLPAGQPGRHRSAARPEGGDGSSQSRCASAASAASSVGGWLESRRAEQTAVQDKLLGASWESEVRGRSETQDSAGTDLSIDGVDQAIRFSAEAYSSTDVAPCEGGGAKEGAPRAKIILEHRSPHNLDCDRVCLEHVHFLIRVLPKGRITPTSELVVPALANIVRRREELFCLKRYADFEELHDSLVAERERGTWGDENFSMASCASVLPELPAKSLPRGGFWGLVGVESMHNPELVVSLQRYLDTLLYQLPADGLSSAPLLARFCQSDAVPVSHPLVQEVLMASCGEFEDL